LARTNRPFHRGLDRGVVLAAALRVLDAEGREALTMRRLARELEVEAASLYTHVRNKDDLIDGVLDRILTEIRLPEPGLPWRPAITAAFGSYRDALLAHPAAVPLMTQRAQASVAQYRLVERSIELLEEGGLRGRDTVQTHVALVAFTIGFVVQEVGRSPSAPAEVLEFSPAVRRAIGELVQVPVADRFRAGLDLILDGAQAGRRSHVD
jgi:AcrR family transcriptional regulator